MVKETHTKGGYLFALLVLPFINIQFLDDIDVVYKTILILIYIYFAYLGSIFPDIDMKGSYVSKRFPIIYKSLGKRFRHRSFTHSLISLSLIRYISEILIYFTLDNIVFICISSGFFVGYLSHICLDLLTKEGVEIFYPITINFSILPIKTNSKLEKLFCKALNFIVIFLLGYRFYFLI